MKLLEYIKVIFLTDIKLGTLVFPINLLDLLLRLILPTIVLLLAYKFIKKGIRRSIYKSKLTDRGKDNLFKWIKLIFRVAILITITLLFINILGAQITLYLSAFATVLTKPFISGISITTILLIIPILYLSQVIGKVAQKFTEKSLKTYFKINLSTQQTITFVIKNITIALIILFGLTVIGIDLTLLIGFFGVIGIGIGFGMQDLIGNLFAGIVIITTKPVKVGDHIIVDGTEGKIVEIRFLQSIVSTITHESIIIPNSTLIDNPVHNYSYDDRSIIIKNSVQVSYETDLDSALEVLSEVAKECPFILSSKEIKTRVVSFDDSGITLNVISWIKDSAEKYEAQSFINLEIWRAFKGHGIEIPYPKMDVTLLKS